MNGKKIVLFICMHNSARSQMAEGILRYKFGDKFKVYSAGTKPSTLNPHIPIVMKEIGIDVTKHYSKHVNEFIGLNIDFIITVCDNAKEKCPFFPGGKYYIHKNFRDPSGVTGTLEEIRKNFREVRDEIYNWISNHFLEITNDAVSIDNKTFELKNN